MPIYVKLPIPDNIKTDCPYSFGNMLTRYRGYLQDDESLGALSYYYFDSPSIYGDVYGAPEILNGDPDIIDSLVTDNFEYYEEHGPRNLVYILASPIITNTTLVCYRKTFLSE